jgi:hypothetical protein
MTLGWTPSDTASFQEYAAKVFSAVHWHRRDLASIRISLDALPDLLMLLLILEEWKFSHSHLFAMYGHGADDDSDDSVHQGVDEGSPEESFLLYRLLILLVVVHDCRFSGAF